MPDATEGTHEVTAFFSLNTTPNLFSNCPIVYNIPSAENYYINKIMSDNSNLKFLPGNFQEHESILFYFVWLFDHFKSQLKKKEPFNSIA